MRMEKRADIYGQIAEALLKTDGSSKAAREVLLEKLGPGVMYGLEALLEYENADEENLMAPAAEMEAVSVARRMVRPMLEGKLQRRLDALDALDGSKKKTAARSAR